MVSLPFAIPLLPDNKFLYSRERRGTNFDQDEYQEPSLLALPRPDSGLCAPGSGGGCQNPSGTEDYAQGIVSNSIATDGWAFR